MPGFEPPTYTQRAQELVDAINKALYEMRTRDWPTFTYKIEGHTLRTVRLAIAHISTRDDADKPYYAALLTGMSRVTVRHTLIVLSQHDLDHIAKQVGVNPMDYEAL